MKTSMYKKMMASHLYTRLVFNVSSDHVGALLLAGADQTITDDRGRTPIPEAVEDIRVRMYEQMEILSLLDVSGG